DLGFGQDIWMISPDQVTQILCIFFFSEIMYAIVITMTKISVVLFYLRIFYEPSFRKACLAIFTITVLFGIWHILQILLVSWPVSYNWTFWDGRHTGRRGHVKIFSFVNGGINIALDLSLCVLPVTQL
ncbi:CFEM domain-containing protein, partial [Colletotrichum higginsianum]